MAYSPTVMFPAAVPLIAFGLILLLIAFCSKRAVPPSTPSSSDESNF
jgi:hypothetical protein